MNSKAKNIFLAIFAVGLILSVFISDCHSTSAKTIDIWLPYWDIKNCIQIINNDKITEKINRINLFFYAFDKELNIINTTKDNLDYQKIMEVISKKNIKIIPTITNDIFYSKTDVKLKDPEIIHQILTNKELKEKHIKQILELVNSLGAEGIDIDYENIDIKDKDSFTEFIKELSILLHKENKILLVTVQQKFEDHQRSGPGAIDWKEISQYADKVIIMCYNYSSKNTKPGPIAPIFWLEDIIKFAVSQIPQEKICIALTLHGYDWSEKTNSLNLSIANNLIQIRNAKLLWDNKSQSPHFVYSKDGSKHQVWFENEKSISEKIKIINRYNIPHLALWHLGALVPSLSELIDLFLEPQ